MPNKSYFVLILATMFCLSSFSQEDLHKPLEAGHWICTGKFSEHALTFTKKAETKSSPVEIRFLPSGKILRCDSVHEMSTDYEGKEYRSDRIGCDSLSFYTLKKDMIRISKERSKNWYFKIVAKPNGYEFTGISSEEYNKK